MKCCKVIAWLDDNNKWYRMKNLLHKKVWEEDTNQAHIEPPTIPLVKEISTGKSDGYYVKLKLWIDTESSTSDLYEFKMSLFDHDKPEEFLLFVWNFQMNLVDTGMLETEIKVKYLCTLVRGGIYRMMRWKIQRPP